MKIPKKIFFAGIVSLFTSTISLVLSIVCRMSIGFQLFSAILSLTSFAIIFYMFGDIIALKRAMENSDSSEQVEQTPVNKIEIPLPNGFFLFAEQNTDPCYPYEVFIGVTDGNGAWWQDLAIVRNAYQAGADGPVWADEEFDVLVYADKDSEDYTHDFSIGIYHGAV